MPYGLAVRYLKDTCKRLGWTCIEQEESYTSKASFFDNDPIPMFHPDTQGTHVFSGSRRKRGEYMTAEGYTFNLDVNGALNILRKSLSKLKSNAVGKQLETLCDKGVVDTPVRIKIA